MITDKEQKQLCRKRPLLENVTRSSMLSPNAKRLHIVAAKLSKKNQRMRHNMLTYQQRLKEAKKFSTTEIMKEIASMTKIQQQFFYMHLQNTSKKPQVILIYIEIVFLF